MENNRKQQEDLKLVGSTITALARKYGYTRQHIRNLLTGKTLPKSTRAQKVLADARAINNILERETTITI